MKRLMRDESLMQSLKVVVECVSPSTIITEKQLHINVSGFFALLLVVVATVMFFNILSPTHVSWIPDLIETNCGDKATFIAVSRKLKENGNSIKSGIKNVGGMGKVNLNDYNPIDPSPTTSSKALNPGPIEHGTPLNPYIPKPSPPDHPKPGDAGDSG
ncbi:unnamed protein product [Sphenostylis stenocarpa]|uniref:Transmembrane protein n=1 Tax=Sphenostylis stenocarpa TaxID=92480 RepID=A0AA86TF78_9FABA|nr:unnamed protein product [Sphenostylis stenocarpa]